LKAFFSTVSYANTTEVLALLCTLTSHQGFAAKHGSQFYLYRPIPFDLSVIYQQQAKNNLLKCRSHPFPSVDSLGKVICSSYLFCFFR